MIVPYGEKSLLLFDVSWMLAAILIEMLRCKKGELLPRPGLG
jgi:hypothetical protein